MMLSLSLHSRFYLCTSWPTLGRIVGILLEEQPVGISNTRHASSMPPQYTLLAVFGGEAVGVASARPYRMGSSNEGELRPKGSRLNIAYQFHIKCHITQYLLSRKLRSRVLLRSSFGPANTNTHTPKLKVAREAEKGGFKIVHLTRLLC